MFALAMAAAVPAVEISPAKDQLVAVMQQGGITPSKSGQLSAPATPQRSRGSEDWTNVTQKKKAPPALDPRKNEEFHKTFKEIPESEILADGLNPFFLSFFLFSFLFLIFML